jgi:hypothetical protein
MARHRAEARSAQRLDLAQDWAAARRPASLEVARRDPMAVAAQPEELAAEAREAAARLRAESAVALVLGTRLAAVLLPLAEAPSLAAGARWLARSAAEVGPKALHSAAAAEVSEQLDAVMAVVRPQVAAHAAGLRPGAATPSVVEAAVPEEAEQLDAVVAERAAGLRPVAERAAEAREAAEVLAAAAVQLQEGVGVLAVEAAPLPEAAEARVAAEVPLLAAARVEAEEAERPRAAPGVLAVRREAVASVFRPDRLLPWLGPGQAARSAHALQKGSTASP